MVNNYYIQLTFGKNGLIPDATYKIWVMFYVKKRSLRKIFQMMTYILFQQFEIRC